MDLNDLTLKFLDEVCERDTSSSQCLKGSEDILHELAEACRSTDAFKTHIEEVKEMKDVFSLNISGKDFAKNAEIKLQLAWKHFVDRLNGAPTSVHAKMAVVLVIPIISDFMHEMKGAE